MNRKGQDWRESARWPNLLLFLKEMHNYNLSNWGYNLAIRGKRSVTCPTLCAPTCVTW